MCASVFVHDRSSVSRNGDHFVITPAVTKMMMLKMTKMSTMTATTRAVNQSVPQYRTVRKIKLNN